MRTRSPTRLSLFSSCAFSFFDIRMTRWYRRFRYPRSTVTTRVCVISSETTTPSRFFPSPTGAALLLAEHRLGPRQVLPRLPQPRGILGHPHRELEAQIEDLFVELTPLLLELLFRQLAPLRRLHDQSLRSGYSARVCDTNLVVMPIFWAAVRNASRATSSGTPIISYRMRPGFTTATHSSGLPLPLPIRVSAGFLVTGLSGNTRIQTLPPRLRLRVSATRAASIWRLVTQPGSCAFRPKSPKARLEPRVAMPFMRPRWALRYLTRFGISMRGRPHASAGVARSTSPLKTQTFTPMVPYVVWAVARP